MKPSYSVFMFFLLLPLPRGDLLLSWRLLLQAGPLVEVAPQLSGGSSCCRSAWYVVHHCTLDAPRNRKKAALCFVNYKICFFVYDINIRIKNTHMYSAANTYHKDLCLLLSLLWARTVSCNRRRLGRLLAVCIWCYMGPYGWLWPIPRLAHVNSKHFIHTHTNQTTTEHWEQSSAELSTWPAHFFLIFTILPHKKCTANHWAKVNSQTHNDTHTHTYIYIYIICNLYYIFANQSFLVSVLHLCFFH